MSTTNSSVTSRNLRGSTHLDQVGFSDIVQIRNRVLELRARGEVVHQFEGGEPFRPTADHIKVAMQQALLENKTRYAASSGISDLRAALAAKLQARNHIPATAAGVIVVGGGMHGLFSSFQCALDAGDEVLMFSPFWTPIRDLIAFVHATPVLIPTIQARENGLAQSLLQFVTPRLRAIYYNTPQNPNGVVLSRPEAEVVAEFAREHDLVVIADEAYEDLVYEGEHVSIASLPGMYERTITNFTFSKSYAMTGWRLGYTVASEPWMTGLRKTVLYSTNGVSTPTQWAGLAAIQTPLDSFVELRAAYRQRRDLMVNGLNELGLPCDMPAGAFYAFPDVSRVNRDSRVAAGILLDQAQVATVPGIVFGPHGESHLRFSFSTSPEAIAAGLESLRKNL